MVVGQRQPQLGFQPAHVLRKAQRLAGQATIVAAATQVLAFDKTGVDRCAGGRCTQAQCKLVLTAKDQLAADLDNLAAFAPLDHLGVEQVRQRNASFGRHRPAAGPFHTQAVDRW